ncbi:MAG: hypothetical protein JXR63_03560 [Spirochaetales bacterium]|nr:hypothetical protein [Spirochaetales bacterium]
MKKTIILLVLLIGMNLAYAEENQKEVEIGGASVLFNIHSTFESGKPSYGWLLEECVADVYGTKMTLPYDTTLFLYEDGSIKEIIWELENSDYTPGMAECFGKYYPANSIAFHHGGKVREIRFYHEYNEITFENLSGQTQIAYIRGCRYWDKYAVVPGQLHSRYYGSINFNEDGEIRVLRSGSGIKINTSLGEFEAVELIHFYDKMKIRSFVLKKAFTYQTKYGELQCYKMGFNENGALEYIILNYGTATLSTSIGDITVGPESEIDFYPSGELFVIQVYETFRYKGKNYKGKNIGFKEDGSFIGEMEWSYDNQCWEKK